MLISKQTIAKYRDISRGVSDGKINPYIDDAENIDIKPLLGELLYNAVKKTPEDHTLLIEGGEYEYKDETYSHPGLEKALSIFAFARYIYFGASTDTAWGFVEKENQNSTPVSASHKKTVYTKERQTAATYFSEVATFLNRTNYNLWKSGCAPRRSGGFRISKIS
ncbi:hypothetical protein INR75_06620 [Zunongwangia sp. SCSIO 43204]|uniref:DUF6712 family protein n=1 Tax=Zunongwangia sp. SCSIO 43204 TaxID=2779359 RepID=UPI001CAA0170|nr:DUF6712 family protein [Zunongwangia sp. SCSIO 43204]UAB85682.1 hypothetical protein INR75_06620 [Zunongwangia sp. SCSIO 43204]